MSPAERRWSGLAHGITVPEAPEPFATDPSDLLRAVARRVGVKEARGIDGRMHPVDQSLLNSAFVKPRVMP